VEIMRLELNKQISGQHIGAVSVLEHCAVFVEELESKERNHSALAPEKMGGWKRMGS